MRRCDKIRSGNRRRQRKAERHPHGRPSTTLRLQSLVKWWPAIHSLFGIKEVRVPFFYYHSVSLCYSTDFPLVFLTTSTTTTIACDRTNGLLISEFVLSRSEAFIISYTPPVTLPVGSPSLSVTILRTEAYCPLLLDSDEVILSRFRRRYMEPHC